MKTLAKYINKLEDETRLEAIWWQIEDEATNLYNTLTNPRYWKNIKKAIIDDRTIDTERFAIDFRGNFFEQLQKSLEYYLSDDCFVDFKQHKEEYKVMREMNQMFTDRDRLRDKFDEALVWIDIDESDEFFEARQKARADIHNQITKKEDLIINRFKKISRVLRR